MVTRADAHRDEFHRGNTWKRSVRCATTANVTIATALNAGDTIDGVTLAAGDRVLVKNQSSGLQNGLYVAGPAPARAYDMDDGTEALGALVYVREGTANGGKLFANTNTTLPTIDTDALTFAEFGGGGSAITVQDEGSPLTTAAATLNFVGAGVVASGSGATKTITIPAADLSAIDFLVGTASGLLSGEIVAGTTPGGELGGTWASPTVDATHSGSPHSDYVAKADDVAVSIVIDGGGSVIGVGRKVSFKMPRAGHFRSSPAIVAPNESGSIVFDIWVRNGALPTITQTITASAKPTLTSSQFNDTASAMTSWITAFGAGDWVTVNVDSVTSLTLAILALPIDWT